MEQKPFTQDDLLDIVEMNEKIEEFISDLLEDCDPYIAMSVLIGSSVKCMLLQCMNFDDAFAYRNTFIEAMDAYIKRIQLNRQKNP